MLRSAAARASFHLKVNAANGVSSARALSLSATRLAVAPPPKKQLKVVRKKEVKAKVKKGGMTHLKFGEAVRQLKFEKLASDLAPLKLEQLSAENLDLISSKVTTYDPQTEKVLRELGSFRKNQNHELFARPVSMVTENTARIHAEFIDKLEGPTSDNRLCLLGEKGIGKSTLLSQVQALVLSKHKLDVVLLHVDLSERIVNGTSDYIFNPALNKFHQPMFTKRWIKKVRAANETVFKKMTLTEDVSFVAKKEKHLLKKGTHTLWDYVVLNNEFGFFGPSNALQFFIAQLKAHSKNIPVLFSMDNFNSMLRKPHTEYFHTDMRPIELAELEFGDFVSQLVSGAFSFDKGGLLLSESKDSGECKTLRVGLGLEQPNPYDEPLQCYAKFAEQMTKNGGVKPFHVESMTKLQANELLLFLDKTGVLQIREYPTKELYKSLEESAAIPGNTVNVGEYVKCQDPETQFERILQSSYFTSAGNPGKFLKINSLTY